MPQHSKEDLEAFCFALATSSAFRAIVVEFLANHIKASLASEDNEIHTLPFSEEIMKEAQAIQFSDVSHMSLLETPPAPTCHREN